MWLIDALTALVTVVIAHSALCRASLPLNSVTRFLISGGVVGACLVWRLLDRYGATASQTWAATLMFAFGCEPWR
jgi:hypothetical protein